MAFEQLGHGPPQLALAEAVDHAHLLPVGQGRVVERLVDPGQRFVDAQARPGSPARPRPRRCGRRAPGSGRGAASRRDPPSRATSSVRGTRSRLPLTATSTPPCSWSAVTSPVTARLRRRTREPTAMGSSVASASAGQLQLGRAQRLVVRLADGLDRLGAGPRALGRGRAPRRLDPLDGVADRVGGLARRFLGAAPQLAREGLGLALLLGLRLALQDLHPGARRVQLELLVGEAAPGQLQLGLLLLEPRQQVLGLRLLLVAPRPRVGHHRGRQARAARPSPARGCGRERRGPAGRSARRSAGRSRTTRRPRRASTARRPS